MSNYRQPQFLSGSGSKGDFEPNHRVRCPIHGFLRYSANERKVIDHPLFRRLRHIRQLALTEYVYPGATHTRFAHSLGAMHLAATAFDSLAAKSGALMERTFKKVDGFARKPLVRARQIVRLAALLHDVGHAPFSHAVEKAIFKDKSIKHEGLTVHVVRQPELMGGLIDSTFGKGTAELVAEVIEGAHEKGIRLALPLELALLHDLVSGEMDSDRSDYLLRDSYYCGVDYGRFDVRRLIDSMDVAESESGELEIVLKKEGLHAFEALILARYMMNTQVYYHKGRRIYDDYLEKYFNARTDLTGSPDEILRLNDVVVLGDMMKEADSPQLGGKHGWAERIINRRHHRMVFETGENADVKEIREAKQLFGKLKARFPEITDWIYDDLEKVSIHKLLRPSDTEDSGWGNIRLVSKDGRSQDVGRASQVFSTIPRTYQCHRIYADLEPDNHALRKKLRTFVTRTTS